MPWFLPLSHAVGGQGTCTEKSKIKDATATNFHRDLGRSLAMRDGRRCPRMLRPWKWIGDCSRFSATEVSHYPWMCKVRVWSLGLGEFFLLDDLPQTVASAHIITICDLGTNSLIVSSGRKEEVVVQTRRTSDSSVWWLFPRPTSFYTIAWWWGHSVRLIQSFPQSKRPWTTPSFSGCCSHVWLWTVPGIGAFSPFWKCYALCKCLYFYLSGDLKPSVPSVRWLPSIANCSVFLCLSFIEEDIFGWRNCRSTVPWKEMKSAM